ncbi:MAG: DUF177 domain-containing protein [Proteobacteria bacterium]|nr:DUF177 domain-containing protein [Pseudomonadota bacterium]
MTPPWSKPLEVDRLADGAEQLVFAVPLQELPGLQSRHGGVGGEVHGTARFLRQRGLPVAELSVQGAAMLECQRCMQPMEFPIDSQVRVALIGQEAEAAKVPEDLEPMLAPGGRISIAELITEELSLGLPIVPLHAAGGGCAARAAPAAGEAAAVTQKPFAQLAQLLKRD